MATRNVTWMQYMSRAHLHVRSWLYNRPMEMNGFDETEENLGIVGNGYRCNTSVLM